MTDTGTLRTLRTVINRMLCEEEGHEWKAVEYDGIDPSYNTTGQERCSRCGKTRMTHSDTGTTDVTVPGRPKLRTSCKRLGCTNRTTLGSDYCREHGPSTFSTGAGGHIIDTANERWTLSSSPG